jgi:hypothetical protein
MKPKLILIPIILILLLSNIMAYDQYTQWQLDANIGFDSNSASQLSWTAYASNKPNLRTSLNSSSYEMCSMSPGTQEPSIFYSSVTQTNYIFIINSASLYIYDLNCGLVQIITLPSAAVSMAQFGQAAVGGISLSSIIIPTASAVYGYRLNTSTLQYDRWFNYSNPAITNIRHVSCNGILGFTEYCFVFYNSTKNIGLLDLASNTYTIKVNQLSYNEGAFSYNHPQPISPINPDSGAIAYYRLPFCSETGIGLNCDIMDGGGVKLFTSSAQFVPTTTNTVYDDYSFVAKLGNSFRLFRSFNYDNLWTGSHNQYGQAYIADILADSVYMDLHSNSTLTAGAGAAKSYSNWAVGDYNQDGFNEACIVYRKWPSLHPFLSCYNSAFNNILDINVTSLMNANNLVMADFVPQSNRLAFATYEGIFYFNDTSDTLTKFYDTGKSGAVFGHNIVSGYSTPFFLYSSSAESFIVRQNIISSSCGDGICQSWENQLSCPADCPTNATGNTYAIGTAPQGTYVNNHPEYCVSGYAELGKCALMPGGYACTSNAQCLSGTCANSKCNVPSLWQLIDASKTQFAGNDGNTNNILSLILAIMLGIGAAVVIASLAGGVMVAALAGASIFAAFIVFFTIVGWLSPFILIGIIIISALVITLSIILKGN